MWGLLFFCDKILSFFFIFSLAWNNNATLLTRSLISFSLKAIYSNMVRTQDDVSNERGYTTVYICVSKKKKLAEERCQRKRIPTINSLWDFYLAKDIHSQDNIITASEAELSRR